MVLVGEAGRGERAAPVVRFDDEASCAQGGDDPVAGDVGSAVLAGLAVELGDEGAAVVEHVAGDARMLGGNDVGQGARKHADGGNFGAEGGAVGGDVDAESQPADDRQPGHPLGQPLDETVAHVLPVGGEVAGADDRKAVAGECLQVALHIYNMGIIRNLAQQDGVLGVGRCDGRDAVAAAVSELLFGSGEAASADDLPGQLGPQFGFACQLLLRRGEDLRGCAEAFEQVHDPLYSETRGHLQRDVFDGHGEVFLNGRIRGDGRIGGPRSLYPK